jgi:aminopeptidase N
MLRRRMGDTAFLKLLAELRRRYEMKTVTTEDFRAMVREFRPAGFSADAVDMYFDNWVYSTGVPSWKLQYTVKGVAPSVTVSGTITQSGVDEEFAAEAPVEVQFGRGPAQTIWVRASGESRTFTANLRQVPTRVGIPDDTLMKK